MQSNKTIYALSSGSLPSGVAVIRVSGKAVRGVLIALVGMVPEPRVARLCVIKRPEDGEVLDQGLVLFFPGPESFTGEDCAEFQVHGSRAVVAAVLEVLAGFPDTIMAEAGEFTRRAYLNDKMDLTEVEGLSDLLAAETESQRRQAVALQSGALRDRCGSWREELVRLRAYIEAEIDFADEDDVPGSVSDQVWERCRVLLTEIDSFLDDNRRGEIVREGFRVALVGPPNAGKSSLLNALAKRDVAIVSDEPGTTRDVIEVTLDLNGVAVIVGDTAGQRQTDGKVELEGIRRAKAYAEHADLVLGLVSGDQEFDECGFDFDGVDCVVMTKSDLVSLPEGPDSRETCRISVVTEGGLQPLIGLLKEKSVQYSNGEAAVITRSRHRELLTRCFCALSDAVASDLPLELRAEELRVAGDALGAISGKIDVEELLGAVFSEFCVGK